MCKLFVVYLHNEHLKVREKTESCTTISNWNDKADSMYQLRRHDWHERSEMVGSQKVQTGRHELAFPYQSSNSVRACFHVTFPLYFLASSPWHTFIACTSLFASFKCFLPLSTALYLFLFTSLLTWYLLASSLTHIYCLYIIVYIFSMPSSLVHLSLSLSPQLSPSIIFCACISFFTSFHAFFLVHRVLSLSLQLSLSITASDPNKTRHSWSR